MNPFEINTPHGGELYNLFYILAFLTMCAFFILSALKHNYPFQKLMLIMAAGVFFFILGNKFFAIPPRDWKYLFTDPEAVSHGAKTMLGGLIGLIVGSILIIRWLKLDFRVADYAAIGLPLSMAVTRLGCLYSGCCYGKITGLPWAVHYTAGYKAFDSQVANGLIHQHDALSLPVHPAQLYDIICCLLIALILWKFAGFLKARGNKLLFAILLYGAARFFLEFFRDSETNFYAAETWLGIKYIQWILIGSVFLMGSVIWLRERRSKGVLLVDIPDNNWSVRPVSLLIFILVGFTFLFNWFDPVEKTTISLVLIPAIVMLAWNQAMHYLMRHYRMVTAMSLMFGLLFMGQTYIPENDTSKVRFFEVGAGGLFGKYYSETAQLLWQPDDCGGGYYGLSNVDRQHSFQNYGVNASYHVRTGKYKRMGTGLNGFYGLEREFYSLLDTNTGAYIPYRNKHQQFALNPYVSYDLKNVGIDVGFHYGNFRVQDKDKKPTMDDIENTIPPMHFYPQFGFRLGPQHILYLDARYCNAFPTCFPNNLYSIGLASGLGMWNGLKLGAGYSSAGYYTAMIFPIKEKYIIEASFIDDLSSSRNFSDRITWSISMRFRFGYKPIKGVY